MSLGRLRKVTFLADVRGRPRYVFSRGRKIVDGDAFVGDPHGGIHQKSAPFRPVQL